MEPLPTWKCTCDHLMMIVLLLFLQKQNLNLTRLFLASCTALELIHEPRNSRLSPSLSRNSAAQVVVVGLLEDDPPHRGVAIRNARFRPYWIQAEEKEWQGLWDKGAAHVSSWFVHAGIVGGWSEDEQGGIGGRRTSEVFVKTTKLGERYRTVCELWNQFPVCWCVFVPFVSTA